MTSDALTSLAASYAWSIAQVTLFATVALATYAFVRRQSATENVKLLAASLAIVALLTVSFVSPWPSWSLADRLSVWSTSKPPSVFRVSHYVNQATTSIPLTGDAPPAIEEATQTRIVPILVQTPAAPDPSTSSTPDRNWLQLALVVVALPTSLGLARFACGLWAVHRYRKSSQPIDDPQLRDEFASLVELLQITRPVELREAPTLAVPATIGCFHPLVLVPPSFRNWIADERRAVLAHELAHIAERHFPLWLVAQFAVAANFYHPLVHWLVRRLRLEQELAADARALQVFTDRRAYANLLANLALAPARSSTATASLGLYMSRPLLIRRIAMLRQNTAAPRPSRFASSLAAAVLIVTAMCATGLRSAPAASAEDESQHASATVSSANELPAAADDKNRIQEATVTALFQVSRSPSDSIAQNSRAMTDKEWEIYCETQITYLYSAFVLKAALGNAEIQQLPIIKEQKDPLQWLVNNLDVGFFANSEIMFIRLTGKPSDADQLRALVDAVAAAYSSEVVFAADQRRLVTRNAFRNSHSKLSEEIIGKMEEQQALARELGAADQDGRSRILQELDVKRLDRIEIELLRLEDEQLAAKTYADELDGEIPPKESAKLKFYEQRIADLEKRRTELEERIIERNQSSVELVTLSQELKQLQAIASEMNLKLESLDIEAVAPNRIRQIQKAM